MSPQRREPCPNLRFSKYWIEIKIFNLSISKIFSNISILSKYLPSIIEGWLASYILEIARIEIVTWEPLTLAPRYLSWLCAVTAIKWHHPIGWNSTGAHLRPKWTRGMSNWKMEEGNCQSFASESRLASGCLQSQRELTGAEWRGASESRSESLTGVEKVWRVYLPCTVWSTWLMSTGTVEIPKGFFARSAALARTESRWSEEATWLCCQTLD